MPEDDIYRILSLDGGGAKGFYTLGVLHEIEGMVGCRLHERFDLVFGTSTGAIIAALIALGNSVEEIHELYKAHVPTIMQRLTKSAKTEALQRLATEVFEDQKFDAFRTDVGIVTAKWIIETPMIFKTSGKQAHGRAGTFSPGFGCTIADAVQASCSAYPFFERKIVTTDSEDRVELIDGGYCANNPTLYAIADAVAALEQPAENIRVVNVGVGVYPEPKYPLYSPSRWARWLTSVQLLQKTLEINTKSMETLRSVLFKDIGAVRISDTYETPEMATDMFEHDLDKLNLLRQRGRESFARYERQLEQFLK